MNVKVYREGRVKLTPEMRSALIDLMKVEKDTGLKKLHAAKWYRDEVANRLKLKDVNNSSLRSYEVAINELRDKFNKVNALDQEWHMGTTINDYPLSPQGVAKIIEYKLKAKMAGDSGYLTIRVARWMDKLSALRIISVEKMHFFAYMYSVREELNELIGEEYALSSKCDDELLFRTLEKFPDEMQKDDFEPLTENKLAEIGQEIIKELTPERIKTVQDKVKKHQNELKRMVNRNEKR